MPGTTRVRHGYNIPNEVSLLPSLVVSRMLELIYMLGNYHQNPCKKIQILISLLQTLWQILVGLGER